MLSPYQCEVVAYEIDDQTLCDACGILTLEDGNPHQSRALVRHSFDDKYDETTCDNCGATIDEGSICCRDCREGYGGISPYTKWDETTPDGTFEYCANCGRTLLWYTGKVWKEEDNE